MNTDTAAKTIWNYMLMHHTLKKAEVIMVLGNRDTRVAEHAAKLWLDGWAPLLVCSGNGSIHNHIPERVQFAGTTEAQVFADIAIKMGVTREAIIIEGQSQSTGQNYEFSVQKLKDRGIKLKTAIIVQKPYMERRSYATGKIWLPDVELIISSPPIPFEDYPNEYMSRDKVINSLVGDVQRIMEYPKKGFQIEQDVPGEVWEAYEYLVKQGYTERLIKD